MDWITFFSWVLAIALAYALFSDNGKAQSYDGDTRGRQAGLMCGTCRKFQKHEEIEPYLFECKKCGRETDLRGGINHERPGITR